MLNTHTYRAELAGFICQKHPYALVTMNLNVKTSEINSERMIRSKLTNIFLRADQAFLNTRQVIKRPRHSRFEGLCFPEKLTGFPHVHVVLFTPEGGDRSLENEKLKFLLRRLPTEFENLNEKDILFAFQDRRDMLMCKKNSITSSIEGKQTVHVKSVHDPRGLSDYVTKEVRGNRERFFSLSELQSPNQFNMP